MLAGTGQGFPGFGQFVLPGFQLHIPGPGLQQGVALLQRPAVATPDSEEPGFHVEQAPVEEAPARLAATAYQGMAAGFEGDDCQRRAQVAKLRDRGAIQAPFPRLAAVAQTGTAYPPVSFDPFDEDLERTRPLPHQAIPDPAAEATAVSHQVGGFQHAGLAGTVGPEDEIEAWARTQLYLPEAAQVGDVEPSQAHRYLR